MRYPASDAKTGFPVVSEPPHSQSPEPPGRGFSRRGVTMPEGVKLSVRITGLTLTCSVCGDTARVDHRTSDQVAEAGSRWMVSHLAPELVAVEVESSTGETAEWVASNGRGRLT